MLQIIAATLDLAVYCALTLQSNEFNFPPSHTSIWLEQGRENVARVPKIAYVTGHSLLSQFLKFVLPNPVLCIVKNMCVYVHISDSLERVCALTSLPNKTTVKHFYTNRGGTKCWLDDCICTVHVVRSLSFNTNTCTTLTSQVKIY